MAGGNSDKETPLMKQYYTIKAQYPGAILLFRVGDFYETFSEDARIASKVLGIVLTKRSNGAASDQDLAGFPYHSLDNYLPRLVKAGYRVAICDQLEDPKKTKTIVKRGVTELVTPGVSYNDKVLEIKQSNYLVSVLEQNMQWAASFLDISTGEFLVCEGSLITVKKMIDAFKPSEWILPKQQQQTIFEILGTPASFQTIESWVYESSNANESLCRQFKTQNLKGFGISEMPLAIGSAAAILQYLQFTHHTHIDHINRISRIDEGDSVWIDGFTARNLELTRPIYQGGTAVIDVIDKTCTAMGARMLRNWLVFPLLDRQAIEHRHQRVEVFINNPSETSVFRDTMKQIGDLQRLVSKVALRKIGPRECLTLGYGLDNLADCKVLFENSSDPQLQALASKIDPLPKLQTIISDRMLADAPAVAAKGGIFKSHVHPDLQELRDLTTSGKDKLIEIQQAEIQRSGITSLKIGFNNVFGYYLEVTNSHKDKAPEDWIRKQTLTNAERYITPELKIYEEKILNAEDLILALESELWEKLLTDMSEFVPLLQQQATILAELDVLVGFAQLAMDYNYCKPNLNDGYDLLLKDCRHPVIEFQLPAGESYIPNTIQLNKDEQRIVILTGPNMSGKSAILRQTALAVILAQIGCYVPCSEAHIGITDKIYTRVGASDNISVGESTFMVEMSETASILNNLSDRSLVLLDEIGRGTSTYDGVSLAWSIAEYLYTHPSAPKTLFATHYHELNELESKCPGIVNFHISIKEQGAQIVFLRKLTLGGSEHSFGIHVAQLAGIPNAVLIRATEILNKLEEDRSNLSPQKTLKNTSTKPVYQMNMFQTEDPKLIQVKKLLASIDINTLTPIEALLKLQAVQGILNEKIN
ncbi:MAG: DNA mismatch repair protein MutS [Flavobacteriaceae bacterium]|nr:DNA mismatch repair protein MutS [Flavobacteriaceae bacterium]PHX78055.1 MAG: DNA mismatch repair protein MutS [Flavobacteriales bacterium]